MLDLPIIEALFAIPRLGDGEGWPVRSERRGGRSRGAAGAHCLFLRSLLSKFEGIGGGGGAEESLMCLWW